MDAMAAFARGEEARKRGARTKVFDWDKAARLIKEGGHSRASAGLAEDWFATSGLILAGGEPLDAEETYVYLASVWATPTLEVGGESVACWVWADDKPDWSAYTLWPESAVAILRGEAERATGSAGG